MNEGKKRNKKEDKAAPRIGGGEGYCRYKGKPRRGQRQSYLGESSEHGQTEAGHVRRDGDGEQKRSHEPKGAAWAKRAKGGKRAGIAKMAGLYEEEQLGKGVPARRML